MWLQISSSLFAGMCDGEHRRSGGMSSAIQAHRPRNARGVHKVVVDKPVRTPHGSFAQFSALASSWLGSKWAFSVAIVVVLVWGATGPLLHFSNSWQLVIN